MKKQFFLRSMLGFPLGIALGYIITIIISLTKGQGYYLPCIPILVEMTGNQINAVILQTLLCGLLGTSFAASSVIWEIDNWSIAKQTGVHFLITSLVMMPIAYFLHWMEHSFLGFVSYFGVFITIFISIWLIQYFILRNKIRKMNSKLR